MMSERSNLSDAVEETAAAHQRPVPRRSQQGDVMITVRGVPAVGSKVTIHFRTHNEPYAGLVGTVEELLDGACGVILGVRLLDGRLVDVFWKRAKVVR